MSLVITVYTNEGIIMASDSRSTYNMPVMKSDGTSQTLIGVQTTDTIYKTFLCQGRIGISTCGEASIQGMPIAGYIEEFISRKTNEKSTVETVAQGLIDHFSHYPSIPAVHFIVAGYDQEDLKQHIVKVLVEQRNYISIDTSKQGATWDGEIDVLARLEKPVKVLNDENSFVDLPVYNTAFNFFTLQDALNFAEYAIDVTIKTMNFQNRVKTVGGPIDILAIKPNEVFWVKRKELHARGASDA